VTGPRWVDLWAWPLVLAACVAGDPVRAPADLVVVSQAGSANLAVVDAATGTVASHIEVGMLPHNLVVTADQRTLFVVVVGSQAVAEIDVATMTLRRTMLTAPVPELRPDGTVITAHVDEDAFGHSTCFDCHGPGRAEPKYAGDRPFGILLSPDGGQLLVTHLRSGDLTVLDVASGTIERTVHLEPAGAASEPVALARLGDEIWVALRPPPPSTQPGVLRRLDAATLAPLADLPTGADPGALLAMPGRASVLVSNFESNTVTEHTRAGDAIAHTAAPGPLGLAALPAGAVLALDYYADAVTVLDMVDGGSRTLALARDGTAYANPTHAAVSSDGRSAWIVASGTDGHLLELDLTSTAIVRDVPIDGLSFGVAVVPAPIP
jgi:streptogramin lyase